MKRREAYYFLTFLVSSVALLATEEAISITSSHDNKRYITQKERSSDNTIDHTGAIDNSQIITPHSNSSILKLSDYVISEEIKEEVQQRRHAAENNFKNYNESKSREISLALLKAASNWHYEAQKRLLKMFITKDILHRLKPSETSLIIERDGIFEGCNNDDFIKTAHSFLSCAVLQSDKITIKDAHAYIDEHWILTAQKELINVSLQKMAVGCTEEALILLELNDQAKTPWTEDLVQFFYDRTIELYNEYKKKELIYFLKKAAEFGNLLAQYMLNVFFYKKDSISINENNSSGYSHLSEHDSCDIYEKRLKQAFIFFFQLADEENLEAQHELGICYYFGRGTTLNYPKAVKSFYRAAQHGHPKAQHFMGICTYHGKGVKRNVLGSLRYFNLAAAQNHKTAQFMIDHIEEEKQSIDNSLLSMDHHDRYTEMDTSSLVLEDSSDIINSSTLKKEGDILLEDSMSKSPVLFSPTEKKSQSSSTFIPHASSKSLKSPKKHKKKNRLSNSSKEISHLEAMRKKEEIPTPSISNNAISSTENRVINKSNQRLKDTLREPSILIDSLMGEKRIIADVDDNPSSNLPWIEVVKKCKRKKNKVIFHESIGSTDQSNKEEAIAGSAKEHVSGRVAIPTSTQSTINIQVCLERMERIARLETMTRLKELYDEQFPNFSSSNHKFFIKANPNNRDINAIIKYAEGIYSILNRKDLLPNSMAIDFSDLLNRIRKFKDFIYLKLTVSEIRGDIAGFYPQFNEKWSTEWNIFLEKISFNLIDLTLSSEIPQNLRKTLVDFVKEYQSSIIQTEEALILRESLFFTILCR